MATLSTDTKVVTIILPFYNPPIGWESALVERITAFQDFVGDMALQLKWIVVNDGSARNFEQSNIRALEKLLPTIMVVNYAENRGKGYALRQGVGAASSDYYLVTDADFPYTMKSMRTVLESLQKQSGIAAGNRNLEYYDTVPFFRKVLSQSLRWLLKNVMRLPTTDSQCGLKGFDNAGKGVFLETTIDRFLFDLEFLKLARNKVVVTPVPVTLREGVVFSKVGLKILSTELWNFIKLLF